MPYLDRKLLRFVISCHINNFIFDREWFIKLALTGRSIRKGPCGVPIMAQGYGNVLVHRVIMNAPDGVLVDHINGITGDNRVSNLRLANSSQNLMNTKISKAVSE